MDSPEDIIIEGVAFVPEPGPAAETAKKTVVVICGTKQISKAVADAMVIAIQTRTRGDGGAYEVRSYAKADLYLRIDADVDFGKVKGEILTLGRELEQAGFAGLSDAPGSVCVGPAHPAYAALNLALHHGADRVVLDGLSDDEKTTLKPWIDEIQERIAVEFA